MARTAFREGHVEAGGARLRFLEAGQGAPLVHLHGPGRLRLTPGHDLLCRQFRVMAFEMPGLAESGLAASMARALRSLGLDAFNLIGTSSGARMALELSLQAPDRVLALVLEAPTAIHEASRDSDLERRLPGLATPTLVLLGTRDAAAAAAARVCKERMPNCHLVLVYDAAEDISTDRPEAFAEVVIDFLERHEAFVISRTATVIHP